MIVFYSGWGFWEYDSDEYKEEGIKNCVASNPVKVCSLFELPSDCIKEITYTNKTTTNFLLPCEETCMEGFEYLLEPKKGTIPRFSLQEMYEDKTDKGGIIQRWNEIYLTFTDQNIIDKPVLKKEVQELSQTERNTLLRLVIGMAIDAYKYDPQATKNAATGDKNGISARLATHGIKVDPDTIRKYLNEAKEII